MIIDKEAAIKDFKYFIDLPIFGEALYYQMRDFKYQIADNLEEFKDILELRKMVERNGKKWPKTSNDIKFELVQLSGGLWITSLPGQKKGDPRKIIPQKVVDYIVDKADEMEPGVINRESQVIIPGINGKVFDFWYEKVRDDYIYGITKNTTLELAINYNKDTEQMLKNLKNLDFDKILEIFRLLFENSEFRDDIFKHHRIWTNLIQNNAK